MSEEMELKGYSITTYSYPGSFCCHLYYNGSSGHDNWVLQAA